MKKSTLRNKYFCISYAIVGLTTLLFLLLTSLANKDVINIQNHWIDHTNHSLKKMSSLGEIRKHIGYLGFIHNFKNYLIRRDPVYLVDAERNINKGTLSLEKLKPLLTSNDELKAFSDLEKVIQEYQFKLELAKNYTS